MLLVCAFGTICFSINVCLFFRNNFFRLCRIVLEHFPNVLRAIFKSEFHQKYGHVWEDNSSSGNFLMSIDHWQPKLGKAQMNYLKNGNTAKWDSAFLFHVLLHSSLCLFSDKLQGTQCIITAQSNVVSASMQNMNFQNVLQSGYKVIFDFGRYRFQTNVVHVQKNFFHIKHIFKPTHGTHPSPMKVDMYICRKEWFCINELAELQNDNFIHCKEARIDAAHLHSVIQCAERIYLDLKVSKKVIMEMKAIEKGVLTFSRYNKYCTQ